MTADTSTWQRVVPVSLLLLILNSNLYAELLTSHGIALHGSLKYPSDFTHLEYVNPEAPKGGTLRMHATGTFDSFNLYTLKGNAAHGSIYLHDTLLSRSFDEPLSKYGVIVDRIEQPENNHWIAFHINPNARFQDGVSITAADIVFSFNIIKEKGSPFWRQFYADVDTVTATEPDRVLFTFKNNSNRELPLILGQLPIFAEHWWRHRDFLHSNLQPPVGSGPYRVVDFQAGRYVVYERVKDYWAQEHPMNRGRYNFDRIRIDYFRDQTVALEAFNSGKIDLRIEDNPIYWHQGYSSKALNNGQIIQKKYPNLNPQTLSLVFNARHSLLADRNLREAITWLLEPDWIIKHLLQGEFNRAFSLFSGTDLVMTGLPQQKERALLEPYKDHLLTTVFTTPWHPSPAESSSRKRLQYAHELLMRAGYRLEKGQLTDRTGRPVILELLLKQPNFERLFQGQRKRLADAGIQLNLRTVDSALYLNRIRHYDFDLILHTFSHTPSPGTEQCNFWHSRFINLPGSLNFAAINHPAADALCLQISQTRTRDELRVTANALDRILLWQYQVVPLFYMPDWHIAYRNTLSHPEIMPGYILDLMTWWQRKPADHSPYPWPIADSS